MNYAKTALLLAGMTGLFLAIGYLLGGEAGMLIALAIAAAMNVFAYWNSDKMVLRMHGASQVDRRQAPRLVGLVETLATRAGLPMPRVYVIDTDQPNAFATGRNPENAAVAVTTGLMHRLDDQELAGVLAHELAHVRNRDTLIMTITATVAAMLVQMAISRTREYAADRAGAEICGHPMWLAGALAKIERAARGIDNEAAEANPATAHLFIINPLHGRRMDSLFATHPDTENRIARLREMAGAAGLEAAATGPWG